MADSKAAETEQKPKKGLIAGIIGAIAVIIIIVICVIAFGKPSIVGKYNLTAFIQDGKETTEMLDFMKALGGSYTIEFKKDKTGVLEMKAGDESQSFNFKYDDKKVDFDEESEMEDAEYEFKDNTVTIKSDDGEGMKFVREGK